MRTPPGGLLPALVAVALAAATLTPSTASTAAAAKCNDRFALHAGSCGQRVKDLQWLLAGHKPNAFTKVKPTYRWAPNGAYGARTKAAVLAYKFRIGYPRAGECLASRSYLRSTAGAYFFALLKGYKQRPTCWVALAAARVKLAEPGISEKALKVKALEVAWLGISESPDGSNRGPCISYSCTWHGVRYQEIQASTGAYGAAWCVSTQQAAFLRELGVTFANRSAGVFYVVGYARTHGWLNAKAKVGALVTFLDHQGHMGFVARVTASGFASIEGNQANGVHEVWHPYGSRPYAFVYIPGVA